MILVDANLLIFAATPCPEQDTARTWLDQQVNGDTRVGLPWQSLTSFLRIVTNPRMYRNSSVTIGEAWGLIEAWLDCPTVWVPQPTERHREIFGRMLKSTSGGNLVPDAFLAALAIEHGLTLCSADGDFARFPGLRWSNPLAA
jgi:toxin-antitoxin system PIN domain toxin